MDMEDWAGAALVAVGVCAIAVCVGGFVALLGVWPVMIALGVLHHTWSVVPAWGFWQSLILLWAAMIVLRIPFTQNTTPKS